MKPAHEVAEDNLDQLFMTAFETNHPAMHDWVKIKFQLKSLRARDKENEERIIKLEMTLDAQKMMTVLCNERIAQLEARNKQLGESDYLRTIESTNDLMSERIAQLEAALKIAIKWYDPNYEPKTAELADVQQVLSPDPSEKG